MKQKKNFITSLLKKIGIFLLVLIIYIAILSVVSRIIGYHNSGDSKQELDIMQHIYNISEIVVAFFVIFSALIAVRQYTKYCRSEEQKSQIDYIQKAIDMSGFYKDSIITKYRVIRYVYEKAGIINILEKVKRDNMKLFDTSELNGLLSTEDRKKLKDVQENPIFINAILAANTAFALKLKVPKKCDNRNEVIVMFFSNLIYELLNDLEFFALHFVHMTADNQVVYYPLHGTYLEIVHILYYNIAKENSCITNKYYQNLIELYLMWNNKCEKTHKYLSDIALGLCKGQVVKRYAFEIHKEIK